MSSRYTSSRRVRVALSVLAALVAWPTVVFGQATTPLVAASAFSPGGQELIALNLAGSQTGTFSQGIQLPSGAKVDPLIGAMEVVLKDGVPMLRATEHSEFLITLPKGLLLPQNFTIEVDLFSRDGGPEPDLTLEGTPSINQGDASAHLQISMDATFGVVQIVGGQTDMSEFSIPDPIRVTLPRTLVRVGVSVAGKAITFYANGAALNTTPVQAQFARGSVLRVTLGGVKDADGNNHPVYLARVRVATGAPAVVATALPAAMPMGVATTIPLAPAIVAKVGPQGDASVSWSAIQGATSYFVVRWKVDDASCCKNFSPPTGMNRLDWQDTALPMAGTYGYRVYATTPSGIAVGETTVAYQPVTAIAPESVADRTGVKKLSVPAARTIDVTEITGFGGFESLAPRTIDLAAVGAMGVFGAIAPRTIALTAIDALGSVRSTTRSGVSPAPVPRTIALVEWLGTGGHTGILPRTFPLQEITASGGGAVPQPRTIPLAGWTAAGSSRIP